MGFDSLNQELTDSNVQRHLNSYIHTIINLLKQHDRPLNFEEIRTKLNIDLYGNYSILQALRKNNRIVATSNSLMFKPLYSIRSKEDLLRIIKGLNNEEGIELSKLADSPIDIASFVEELKNRKLVIVLKDMDNSEIMFNNDTPIENVSESLVELWKGIKVPVYHDLLLELNSAGLKIEKEEGIKKRIIVKKGKKKKNRRKIKITNTHVKELDLNGLQE